MPPPDPGWYPDPQDSSVARWWDGTQWTSATQSAATLSARGTSLLAGGKPRRRIDDNFARLAGFLQLLLGLNLVVSAAVIWGDLFVLDVADQFIAGTPDPDDAATSDRINLVSGLGTLLVVLLTAIAFIRWLFVAHSSDRVNPDAMKHKSGWAIGGWFVPVLNLWRPFGVTIDLRRGVLGPGARATGLMWAWWLTLVVSGAVDRYAAGAWLDDDAVGVREFGEDLRTAASADITSNAINIVAAALAVLVVRQLTRLLRDAPVVS